MITVKLFKYNSPNFFINKDLQDVMTATGVLKGETSVLDPVFEIESPNDLSQVNYAWIGDLHRYYYVTNVISVTDRLWRFTCHVDVLMTYKQSIKGHNAIIARQQNVFDLYLPDGETFKTEQGMLVIQKEFTNGFTNGESIVVLAACAEPDDD